MLGEVKPTARGFERIDFLDAYGVECSLQQSSAIDDTERGVGNPGSSFVWLGPNNGEPKVLASEAAAVGVNTTETIGWVPYPIPKEVSIATRAHLNREQVAELIEVLQRWLDTGRFS